MPKKHNLETKETKNKPATKPKKKRKWVVVIIALISAVVLFFVVIFLFSGLFLKTDNNNRTNVIIFGTTEDSEAHQAIGADQARTDSIMLLSVSHGRGDTILTSVPRDFWVRYEEGCAGRNEFKINAVYLCASNDGENPERGAEMLMDTTSEIYGLDIHYYIHLNFTAVEELVDTVGGIEVVIESNDPRGIYDPNIGIQLPNGPVELDGETALRLARARDSTGQGYGIVGDNFAREAHQQQILFALQNKVASREILTSPSTVNSILNSLRKNVRTNLNTASIGILAKKIDRDNVETVSLKDLDEPLITTGGLGGQSIVRPVHGLYNYNEIRAFMQSKLE